MKTVAFLQNAWSKEYAGSQWPRESWLVALHASRTGQRIRTLIASCADVDIWWDNTTPHVGDHPDSVIPPDYQHIRQVLLEQQPTHVLALGQQAGRATEPFCDVPLLIVPHPAYRVVTNELYKQAGSLLSTGFTGIVELKQGRGSVLTITRRQ